jgi:hypothetical protein
MSANMYFAAAAETIEEDAVGTITIRTRVRREIQTFIRDGAGVEHPAALELPTITAFRILIIATSASRRAYNRIAATSGPLPWAASIRT